MRRPRGRRPGRATATAWRGARSRAARTAAGDVPPGRTRTARRWKCPDRGPRSPDAGRAPRRPGAARPPRGLRRGRSRPALPDRRDTARGRTRSRTLRNRRTRPATTSSRNTAPSGARAMFDGNASPPKLPLVSSSRRPTEVSRLRVSDSPSERASRRSGDALRHPTARLSSQKRRVVRRPGNDRLSRGGDHDASVSYSTVTSSCDSEYTISWGSIRTSVQGGYGLVVDDDGEAGHVAHPVDRGDALDQLRIGDHSAEGPAHPVLAAGQRIEIVQQVVADVGLHPGEVRVVLGDDLAHHLDLSIGRTDDVQFGW